MPGGWLFVLTAFLLLWMPMTLAGELTAALPLIALRGAPAIVELLVHGVVTAMAVAAGWALVVQNPHAKFFAVAALAASCGVMVQSLYWSALPSQIMPGDRLPLAAAAIAHAAAWILYLRVSRRVRAIYD